MRDSAAKADYLMARSLNLPQGQDDPTSLVSDLRRACPP